MLKDFTRNLFYFFRGPSSDDNSARDRQLENNLTKSLIVVLEHADNDVFLHAFVRKLGLGPPDGSLRFSLQRKPVGVQTTLKRVVLGITGGRPEPIESRGAADGGRPDAWILTDRWAVLVESKLGPRIADDQLHRHADSAGWAPDSYKVLHLTWQDIYAIFRHELATVVGVAANVLQGKIVLDPIEVGPLACARTIHVRHPTAGVGGKHLTDLRSHAIQTDGVLKLVHPAVDSHRRARISGRATVGLVRAGIAPFFRPGAG